MLKARSTCCVVLFAHFSHDSTYVSLKHKNRTGWWVWRVVCAVVYLFWKSSFCIPYFSWFIQKLLLFSSTFLTCMRNTIWTFVGWKLSWKKTWHFVIYLLLRSYTHRVCAGNLDVLMDVSSLNSKLQTIKCRSQPKIAASRALAHTCILSL